MIFIVDEILHHNSCMPLHTILLFKKKNNYALKNVNYDTNNLFLIQTLVIISIHYTRFPLFSCIYFYIWECFHLILYHLYEYIHRFESQIIAYYVAIFCCRMIHSNNIFFSWFWENKNSQRINRGWNVSNNNDDDNTWWFKIRAINTENNCYKENWKKNIIIVKQMKNPLKKISSIDIS